MTEMTDNPIQASPGNHLAEWKDTRSPQQRDRMMQQALALARGPVRNGDLLREAVDRMLAIRAMREERKVPIMSNALITTLSAVADALEQNNVIYAVTGSLASSLHGEYFESMDVDIVLIASPADALNAASQLAPRFYAPAEMLSDAASRGSIANVIDNQTGLKVDLSFIGVDSYMRQVLQRRIRSRIGSDPREFWFVTPEDIILMKLVWRKDTQSAKQWENALGVARMKNVNMDWKYLFEQARTLGVEADLIKLRDEAGI